MSNEENTTLQCGNVKKYLHNNKKKQLIKTTHDFIDGVNSLCLNRLPIYVLMADYFYLFTLQFHV